MMEINLLKKGKKERSKTKSKKTMSIMLIALTLNSALISLSLFAQPVKAEFLTNGNFETGSASPWRMAISGSGNTATLTTTTDAYNGKYAAKIAVTSCNNPPPTGYIAFNSPMLTVTAGKTYTVTFTYKATNTFEAYFLCQTPTTQAYNKRVVCDASSAWKTVSFKAGPLPSAPSNWFTLRFNRPNTVTIDNISISEASNTSPTPTPTPTPTLTPTPTAGSSNPEFLRLSYMNEGWTTQEIISNVDVCQAHYNGLSRMPEIKALRPDMLTFVYYNTAVVWGSKSSEYDGAKLQLFLKNNWVLKDKTGSYVMDKSGSCYLVDFGNPSYHTWLANWYKSYIVDYGLSGASLDHWTTNYIIFYLTSQNPINPRTGTTWTDQQICDAYKALCQKIRQTIGSDKLILVNGIFSGYQFYSYGIQYYQDAILNSRINALMSEGWVSEYDANAWVSESSWLKSINYAVWLENNFPSAGGKYFALVIGDNSWFTYTGTQGFPTDMTEKQYEQFVTYCFASRYLTVKSLKTIVYLGGYVEKPYAQALFKINIGNPAGDFYKIGNLYARQFTKGLVIVNPTSNAYQANIGTGYKNVLDGTSASSTVTVQPHSGLILSNK
jgi:hypothetical protein